MTRLKDLFLLDPNVIFLNHGSFGATPRPVFEVYQEWQRKLERQPVRFLGTELPDYLQQAQNALAGYLHAHPDDLVFVPNATFGVNLVARSLQLGAGDEVLTTDHEYGACDTTWEFLCEKTGAAYVRQPISLPMTSPEEIVEQLWRGVTPRTKVVFLSHITSPTALRLPVEAICRRARAAGLLTVIDGAHAPGQIPIDLEAIGADFYTGNCHKWLSAPKGSAFLHARWEQQHWLEPLVVSWGWHERRTSNANSHFLQYLRWRGTDDPCAFLAVPAAIQFQNDHNWPAVQQDCHQLLRQALHRIRELTGLQPVYPDDKGFFHQMAVAPLPPIADLPAFKRRLYDEYRVEAPCLQWKEHHFIRISVQGYNTQADIDGLLIALENLISQVSAGKREFREGG